MDGMPEDFELRCKRVLVKCREFGSDRSLRAIFVTPGLSDFRTAVPQATNAEDRAQFFLSWAYAEHTCDGVSLLGQVLDRLASHRGVGDWRKEQLTGLAQEAHDLFDLDLEGDGANGNSAEGGASPHDGVLLDIVSFLSDHPVLDLAEHQVVGGYISVSDAFRAFSLRLCDSIATAKSDKPVCYLVCGEPGSGKTFYVRQLVDHVRDSVDVAYVEANAASWGRSTAELGQGIESISESIAEQLRTGRTTVALLDEVDARFGADYAFAQLTRPMLGEGPTLEPALGIGAALHWFFAASSAQSVSELEQVAQRLDPGTRFADFLSRIPHENRIDLPTIAGNAIEKLVRTVAMIRAARHDISAIDCHVLVYFGLSQCRTPREIKQEVVKLLSRAPTGKRSLWFSDLGLPASTAGEFLEVVRGPMSQLRHKTVRIA